MSRGSESSIFTCDTAFKGLVVVDTVWLAALTYSHVQLRNEVACLKEEVAKLTESCKQTDRLMSLNKGEISAANKTLKTHDSQITSINKKLKKSDLSSNSRKSSSKKPRRKKQSESDSEDPSEGDSEGSSEPRDTTSSTSEEPFDPLAFNEKLNSVSTPKYNVTPTKSTSKHNATPTRSTPKPTKSTSKQHRR